MRRILFPLLVIGLAGGLFTLGSGAFFSDVETDTGNTITAGTLDLEANGNGTTSCSKTTYIPVGGNIEFDGPADNCLVVVQNDGSITGDLYMEIAVVNTGCTGGGEYCGGTGELGGELTATECAEGGSGALAGATNPCDSITDANSLALVCSLVATLDGTETYSLTFDLTDASVTNASQGDSITFNFYFKLIQSGQPAPANCTAI